MAKHLAKKAACLIGSAAVALSMTLGAFPVYADSAASAPELGPVTSKDVVYQIITDRFYDGDTSNNVPAGFDATLYDGTGQDLKLYQGGDWAGIIEKIPYLKGMGVTAVWISAPYENRDTEIIDYQSDGSLNRWTSFHGYHVRNYFATNKHFGTLNEFKELRDALHANGIKLVIDFVTNHTSREMNPTANNIPEDGKLYEPDRKEDGTFAFDENGEPYDYNGDGLVENLIADPQNDTNGWFHGLGDRGNDSSRYGYRYKDLGSLADFSQENQDVAAYLEQATLFWADMGVNGIRHDATLHMDAAFAKGLKDAVDASTGINTTASITLDGGEVGVWQYDAAASAPEIGNVVSTMGRAGNRVYIYGDGLDGNISVKFGETEATVESNTANEIVTYVPDNAVAGYNDITVTKGDAVSNSFTYNVLSGDQNQVIFHVKAETNYGENIYIVGNVPELGSWDPDKCTEALLNPNYPEWFLPVSVPAGTEIQFKFIKKDANGNVTWESGDNRVITSSSLSAGTVDTEVYTWRN